MNKVIAQGIDNNSGQLSNVGPNDTLVDSEGNSLAVTGMQGITGLSGFTGLIGYTGTRGDTGLIGETGIQGLTGLIGNTGVFSNTGIFGATGIQGFTGIQGGQGIQGETGLIGNTGIQGETGLIGNTGIQGSTGLLKIIGFNSNSTSSNITGTGSIPLDGTIPQNTEGTEILSLSYTPSSTSNTLVIEATGFWVSTNGVATLFTSDSANAIAVATHNSSASVEGVMHVKAVITAPSTSSLTISLRMGGSTAPVTNQNTSGNGFSTAGVTTLSVMEIS